MTATRTEDLARAPDVTVRSARPIGIGCETVTVTARAGGPHLALVGLPEMAAREARVRVSAALRTLGVEPRARVEITPEGAGHPLDLPIAVAVLAALGVVDRPEETTQWHGELALDGRVRAVRGAFVLAQPGAIMPAANGAEAGLKTSGVRLVSTLADVIPLLAPERRLAGWSPAYAARPAESAERDEPAAWARELVAELRDGRRAGPPLVLLVGPPGSGKTRVTRRLHHALGRPDPATLDEIRALHSIAGIFDPAPVRPFRAPHHTVSEPGLLGGGAYVRPGEVSLAHGGLLMLDEVDEFRGAAIATLGRVLAEGAAVLGRSGRLVRLPARPALVVATANPCPCGYAGSSTRRCACSAERKARHRARLARCLPWSRVLTVPTLTAAELTSGVEPVPVHV